MSPFTERDLLDLVRDRESECVERKRSASNRSGIRRTICAFANDLTGRGAGVVFIGVEDDGSCAGLQVDDEMLQTLAHMRSDGNILPFPSLSVRTLAVDDCKVVAVIVQPAQNAPVRYDGRVWVKVGPTVQQATPDDERRLAERRRAWDLPFDRRPSESTLDSLDLEYIQNSYLPLAVDSQILARNQRPLKDQLLSLQLVANDRPTQGALIAFGRYRQNRAAGAYILFLRIDGTEITDPIRTQQELTGKLADMLKELPRLLGFNILVRTDIVSRPVETRRPDYPLAALLQLVQNAVMHRSYEISNAPVRVYWYSDRVEIRSPGGLYGAVRPENFGTGVTAYRNPLIAEIMLRFGFAQHFGFGLPFVKEVLQDNGNPPAEFDFSNQNVVVTLRPAP